MENVIEVQYLYIDFPVCHINIIIIIITIIDTRPGMFHYYV